MASTLGEAIRAARERSGMTQAELARVLGVPQTTLTRLESGGRADPRFSTVAQIAAALDISLDELAVQSGYSSKRLTPAELTDKFAKTIAAARTARKALAAFDNALGDLEGLSGSRRRRS